MNAQRYLMFASAILAVILITSALLLSVAQRDKKRVTVASATGMTADSQCVTSSPPASSEQDTVYFVGCGGFF